MPPDIDGLAQRLATGGGAPAVYAREAVWALMDDAGARQELVKSAGLFVAGGFTAVAAGLSQAYAANPGMTIDEVLAMIGRRADVLVPAGDVLGALDGWPHSKGSDVPTLLGAAFGVVLTAAGTVATGGVATVAVAGVGAAGGELSRSAQDDADHSAKHERLLQSQAIHDQAQHLAINALLTAPGDPPLGNLLIGTPPPDHKHQPEFVWEDGLIHVPDPGTAAWWTFRDWMRTKPNLLSAVNRVLQTANFAGIPGSGRFPSPGAWRRRARPGPIRISTRAWRSPPHRPGRAPCSRNPVSPCAE